LFEIRTSDVRVPANGGNSEFGFNMTPMIDVVFLLIIFFLVSSHLARQENRLQLPLPVAESGVETVYDQRPRVTINVLADGQVLLAGRKVDPRALQQRLAREVARVGQDLEIRIRADRSVAYRFVGPILAAAARAGIWKITFAVVRSQDRI
jgi:biopolymer transport protein ExbD